METLCYNAALQEGWFLNLFTKVDTASSSLPPAKEIHPLSSLPLQSSPQSHQVNELPGIHQVNEIPGSPSHLFFWCFPGVSNSDTVRDTEPSKQCKCEGLGSIMQAPCDGPDSAICKCVYGYYRDQESNTCKECKACETGYGLVYPCDDSHDTRCEKCLKGTYSDGANRIDPCFPCTICEEDEIVIKQCTTVSDTVCNTGNHSLIYLCLYLPLLSMLPSPLPHTLTTVKFYTV